MGNRILPRRAFIVIFLPRKLYPNMSNNRDAMSINTLSFRWIVSLNIMDSPDNPPITISFGEKNRLKERANRNVPKVNKDIFSYMLFP